MFDISINIIHQKNEKSIDEKYRSRLSSEFVRVLLAERKRLFIDLKRLNILMKEQILLEYSVERFQSTNSLKNYQIFMSNIQQANQFKAKGNEAFKNKDWNAAIEFFTQAIACNPNDHVFYSNRSGSYINVGEYDKALEDANKCIELNSSWPRGYERKGVVLTSMGSFDQAIETFKQGLTFDPNNSGLTNGLKSAEEKKSGEGNPMMNQQYLQAMMKLISHPETKDFIQDQEFMQKVQMVMQNPASFQYFANDPKIKKAFEVLSSDIPADFNFEDIMKKGSPKPKEEKQESSKMDEEVPEPKREEPKREEPKKEAPKPQPKVEDPAEEVKNKGNAEFKKKNFPAAIDLYEEAIQLKTDEPLYYNNKAAAYIEMGEYQKAHAELDRADQLFENGNRDYVKKAKVLARRASIFGKEGKYQEAISFYERSLVEDNVSKVRDELKNAKKLLKEKQEKEYLNPELAEKACENGNALFKDGKFPAALREYEEAIKRNPDVAKYYSNLGTVYIKLMEWPRAKENFEKCLKKDPNFVKAYGKKGDCHFAMKEYHKALQCFETGLKLEPENQICKAGIQKTQQAIYMSGGSQQDQEERARHAMADPQIQSILQTPQVRNALQDMQSNPAAIQNIMKNPSLAAKIQKLIEAGIIGTG